MKKLSLQAKVLVGSIAASAIGILTTFAASAQTVPTVGTSDIQAVGAPIMTALISNSEYVLETFGPPLFVLGLVIAVFFAVYHRVKVGHWL